MGQVIFNLGRAFIRDSALLGSIQNKLRTREDKSASRSKNIFFLFPEESQDDLYDTLSVTVLLRWAVLSIATCREHQVFTASEERILFPSFTVPKLC